MKFSGHVDIFIIFFPETLCAREQQRPDKGTRDRRAVARRSDTPRSPSKIHSQRRGGARTSNENFLNSPSVIRRVFQDVGAFRALLTVQSRAGFVMRRDRRKKLL